MTQPFHLIALTGPKGCGKDTVATILRTHAGFYSLAFADALRDEVSNAYLVEPLYLIRRETKEHPMSALALRKCLDDSFVARMQLLHASMGQALDLEAPRSPRQIMQWWGTEYRRAKDPDYWVRQLEQRIHRLLDAGGQTRLVITDCRFENEVDSVRSELFGGVVWQVARPGCDVPADAHTSETTGARFAPDAVIDNTGDILLLRNQVLGRWWALEAGLAEVRVEVLA